ncbi:MAG TPA: ATP-binding protein [bacterium]
MTRAAAPRRTLLSWSSGKDAAWALHVLRDDPAIEVAGLFTVVNERHGRAAMHATRVELLERQAGAVGLPLRTIPIPDPCTDEQYRAAMGGFVATCVAEGVACMAFGDLFLQDVRTYRETQLAGTGIEPIFPLWGIPTAELAQRMLDAGLAAYVSCVDLAKLPADFAGRRWSRELLSALPPGCDPCGENGELHTVVVDGPMFRHAVPVAIGERLERAGFAFADIVPAS